MLQPKEMLKALKASEKGSHIMEQFTDMIKKQLEQMNEAQKDKWILSQAKILPAGKRDDFYKSLCGTKKVMNMPDLDEIEAFCRKAEKEQITIGYLTYYAEFDDEGHYRDDWEEEYYDTNNTMPFISSVIRGCHDLIVLKEYKAAYKALDKVLGLKFLIVDDPDSEDVCEYEYMDLYMAAREGLISINKEQLLKDYILACRKAEKDSDLAVEKIVSAIEMELFENCKAPDCVKIRQSDPLFDRICEGLTADLEKFEAIYSENYRESYHSLEGYQAKKMTEQIRPVLEYLKKN